MKYVNFFCFKIPVEGEAETMNPPDGPHKFWWFSCPHDGEEHGYTMRTKVQDDGSYSIQDRLDQFVRKDSSINGYDMIWLKSIRPASMAEIQYWAHGHEWVFRKAA